MHRIIGDRRDGPLPSLIAHCTRIERIASLVRDQLPEPLNRHCHVVNLSAGGVMLLHTDAPVWTSRLRLQAPRLIEQLRRHPELEGLRDIRHKTVPPAMPSRMALAMPPRKAVISDAAAMHLRNAAAGITVPALREALLRLANRD